MARNIERGTSLNWQQQGGEVKTGNSTNNKSKRKKNTLGEELGKKNITFLGGKNDHRAPENLP